MSTHQHRVALIPGDGIGPEVTEATLRVVEAAGAQIDWEPLEAGAEVIAKFGTPVPDSVLNAIRRIGVALKGPVTTPIASGFRSANVQLRQALDLFACVRPVRTIPGLPVPFEGIAGALADYDIVISATASARFVLPAETVASAMTRREGRPLCLIDIAVPRDVDPESRKVENGYLYDIDDLEATFTHREPNLDGVLRLVIQESPAKRRGHRDVSLVKIHIVRDHQLIHFFVLGCQIFHSNPRPQTDTVYGDLRKIDLRELGQTGP